MTADQFGALLGSWEIHLRAERKSPQTVKIYGDGVRAFLHWCDRAGIEPALDRATVNKFTAGLLDEGAAASTARSRQLAVRRFSSWLAEEGETGRDELLGLKPPALDKAVVPKLSGAELAALLKACHGKAFMDRRDEAIIRVAVETAARAEEILAMETGDIDLRRGLATIRRGKGGRGRRVPFGPQTAQALDRYLRLRRAHRLAGTPPLWLGDRGKDLGTTGCGTPWTAAPAPPGSPDSTFTGCDTPRRRGGWPPADPRAASWPWPAGGPGTCSTATCRTPRWTAPPTSPAA
jgi:integrase/recombinase XerD